MFPTATRKLRVNASNKTHACRHSKHIFTYNPYTYKTYSSSFTRRYYRDLVEMAFVIFRCIEADTLHVYSHTRTA